MTRCFGNKDYKYCRHMKNVEVDPNDIHKIVKRSATSYSCAWCTLHNCPLYIQHIKGVFLCQDLKYHCADIGLVAGHFDEEGNWIEVPV